MKTWVIEPHNSFIARDGRPFGLNAGVRAESLPFPFPSTTTGGVRTRDGLNREGVFDTSNGNIKRVKNLSVRGALLVGVDKDESVTWWFAPAPSDALLLDANDKDNNKAKVCRLVPRKLPAHAATNMPDDELMPIYLESKDKNKPHGYAPHFWTWDIFKEWLVDPKDYDIENLYDFGINRLPQDERSHVAIESATQSSEEGNLFQTRGLEFTRQKQEKRLGTATRLALAVATDAAKINKGVASLGGERRLVSWREFQGPENIFDSECPDKIAESIIKNKACRVLLLTPAYFEQGWKPSWIIQNRSIELKAAAIQRAQVISGWDFERGGPKPTRRLVPAGSVYFFKLNGDEEEIRNWISAIWMNCISDSAADGTTPRKDGFGLAVLGTWKEGKE